MPAFCHWTRLRPVLLLLILMLPAVTSVLAQDTPITMGQNVIGDVTATTSTVRFTLSATAGESAVVQVLGVTPDFAPRFRVLSPSDVEILAVDNPTSATTVSGTVSFAETGAYTIEVTGQGGAVGQFLLSTQPGAPLPPPIDLTPGQPQEGVVNTSTPVLIYQFNASAAEPLLLSVVSKLSDTGLAVTLRDTTADKTLAMTAPDLTALIVRIPAGSSSFRVEVAAGGAAGDTPFTICLELASSAGGCGLGQTTSTDATPAGESQSSSTGGVSAAACLLGSGTGGSVNVRGGASTSFAVVATLNAGQLYPVIGRLADNSWYQVNVNGVTGWVASIVIRLSDSCADLPVVAAPAGAPSAPTQPPAPGAPTLTPTTAPPSSPSVTPMPPASTSTDIPPLTPSGNELEPGPGLNLKPDLTITSISTNTDPERITQGVRVNVYNAGQVNAGPFVVSGCFETNCGTASVAGLAAGSQITVTVSIVTNLDPQNSALSAYADINGTVDESDESNNAL